MKESISIIDMQFGVGAQLKAERKKERLKLVDWLRLCEGRVEVMQVMKQMKQIHC